MQLQATSFQSQLTIKQIVRLYAGLYGVSSVGGEITTRLQEIGLEGEETKPFKQLSGGQQQRLSLYVAVVHDPALLLLDEPTAGLDLSPVVSSGVGSSTSEHRAGAFS